MGVTIRDARPADLSRVQAIYTHHVLHGTASFEEEPPSLAEVMRRYDDVLGRALPYLVAELDGAVVGYNYAGPYRLRSAYRFTVENSVYVDAGLAGRGVGAALLGELIARCQARGLREIVAVIGDSANAASIGLHRRFGFEKIGTLRGVGFKFGRCLDSVLMQRRLASHLLE
jgi:L-amino acid N-acyltransferase YncA